MIVDGELQFDWDDEIIAGALLTRDGDITNEQVKEATGV